MKIKHIIYIVTLALLISGCATRKAIQSANKTTIKDSIRVKTNYKYRDTTIYIVGDTNTIKVPIIKIAEQPVYQKSRYTTLSLQRSGNNVVAECRLDSLALQLKLKDKEVEMQRWYIEKQENTIVIPKKYIPKMIKWLAFIGGGFLLSLVMVFGFKYIKR